MASLELKYLELLSFTPGVKEEERMEWQQQVYWAGQTLQLLRAQGEAIIDEVHQALLTGPANFLRIPDQGYGTRSGGWSVGAFGA